MNQGLYMATKIKDELVKLAAQDKLPLDMNNLDPKVFERICELHLGSAFDAGQIIGADYDQLNDDTQDWDQWYD